MQRKNNLLRHPSKRSKKAIAMIMAIIVIVIIATIMSLSLALNSQTTKRTINLYLYEQSILLAKSAAEYALLRIALDNNESNPCNITNLNFTPDINNNGTTSDDFYNINIAIKYSYVNPPASCNGYTFATVTTPEQNGSILLDVTVSVTDSTVTTEPIRYFRRSIQKL